MTIKCNKKKKATHEAQLSVSLMFFLPHFDVFCDPLLNINVETWNHFVFHNREVKFCLR